MQIVIRFHQTGLLILLLLLSDTSLHTNVLIFYLFIYALDVTLRILIIESVCRLLYNY